MLNHMSLRFLFILLIIEYDLLFASSFLHQPQSFGGMKQHSTRNTCNTRTARSTVTANNFGGRNTIGTNTNHACDNSFRWILRSAELHTAYEYISRQRGPLVSQCVNWMDPSIVTVPSPKQKQMGFQIDAEQDQDSTEMQEQDQEYGDSDLWRLPIYPVSAVHLPSSALHTLHNTQFKNIKMSRDLAANQWNIQFHEHAITSSANTADNDIQNGGARTANRDPSQCFVLTLFAQDTHRISSMGTLMEVVSMEDTYTSDKSLIRVVVKCRAIGIVKIEGVEKESTESPNDYLIGRVQQLQLGFDAIATDTEGRGGQDLDLDEEMLDQIQQDYAAVRNMYTTNSIATRELPPYARDAVQANMPEFSKQDFACPKQFWNVAECWQTLCNTVRDARRSDLQTEINEIMIDAACKKKGPLKLPVKREELPDDVQSLIIRMEKEASEDFLSCGLDSCLDFQVLLGMGRRLDDKGKDNVNLGAGDKYQDFDAISIDLRSIHSDRIRFLGEMIRKEKDRLDIKERLKGIFSGSSLLLDADPLDGENATRTSSTGQGLDDPTDGKKHFE